MAYGAKATKEPNEAVGDSWALKALKSFLGFDPAPIIIAMQTEIPDTAQKMKAGIESLVQSMKNIDARLAAIERRLDHLSGNNSGSDHDSPDNGTGSGISGKTNGGQRCLAPPG